MNPEPIVMVLIIVVCLWGFCSEPPRRAVQRKREEWGDDDVQVHELSDESDGGSGPEELSRVRGGIGVDEV